MYYGDESRVCLEPCIPYGWQFTDENVFMPSAKGVGLNCFALLNRASELLFKTTTQKITSNSIIEQLSFSIQDTTVLDNARVHTSKKIQERRIFWQEHGLFLFYLPPYSPHLNIAEVLWRKLKYEWLQSSDYTSSDTLFYTVKQALAAVGTDLAIHFSDFAFG